MTIKSYLANAISHLNGEEANIDARLLLQHLLNVNHAWLIAHADDPLTLDQQATFEALLQRRLNGEPIAYILGEREFYGLNLKVTPDTLIPRPDTETLVEATLNIISQNVTQPPPSFPLRILDLGTGTGAIALAIAKHCPQTQVTAVDFSESALCIARENAKNLAINNVSFLQSNWFAELKNQTFDFIVSNPPYIEENDPHLSQGDLRFEPRTALVSGKNGLDDIRHIISHASNHLSAHGWLMLEHGYNQAKEVANLLAMAEFKNIQHVEDLAGINRVTLGQLAAY